MSEELQTRIWLKGLLEDHYSGINNLTSPESVDQREFGFGSFARKITIRHRAFGNEKELLHYIKKEAPAHVNHSTARYRFPDHEKMESKERLGTDLIFDIDVGDLELNHDHAKDWVCEKCFAALKEEAQKLVDFMTDDFGFSEKELTANFSGSRGYHVRLKSDKLLELGENARKEICSYLSLDMDLSELIYERGGMIFGPKPEQHGLKGRVANTMIKTVQSSDMPNRENVIEQIKEGNWGAFPKGYGVKKILKWAKAAAVKIPVDSKVTTDMTHMIRMPDTIHGGSMMLARTVDNLDGFNPLDKCFVFGDEETEAKFVKKTPSLEARGQTWGPYELGTTKIPKFLAAYYGAKGRCVVTK
jgi:DNA primase small subunit